MRLCAPDGPHAGRLSGCAGWLSSRAAGLNPGSFALVMASGIISIAASLLDMPAVAAALLWANAAFYAALWALTVLRLAAHFPRVRADFTDHARGPSFFTTVAGTCVLGSQIAIVAGGYPLGLGLWVLGALLWLALTYTSFTALIVREAKPGLDPGMHGGWLIVVVATQSVSILASLLAPRLPAAGEAFLFTALCLFLAGGLLYVVLITLLLYRLLFFPLTPAGLPPISWVAMGAAAITTLAGARLILDSVLWPSWATSSPFSRGSLCCSGPRPPGGSRCSRPSGSGATWRGAFPCATRPRTGASCSPWGCTR
jgi:tellurite resistance protein TehA-like permease